MRFRVVWKTNDGTFEYLADRYAAWEFWWQKNKKEEVTIYDLEGRLQHPEKGPACGLIDYSVGERKVLMQYLLTEEEYKALYERANRQELPISKKKLKDLCTKIANTMPITTRNKWRDQENTPWGCYLTVEKEEGAEWYCDDCPVQDICPHPQHYSQ